MVPINPVSVSLLGNIIQFIINIYQFFVGLGKDRRIKKYEKFDYEAHLQILDPKMTTSTVSGHPSFLYSGRIENCGSKTVQIKNVLLEYGSKDNVDERYKYVVERGFYLKTGDQKEIQQGISSNEVEAAKAKFSLEDCHFFLRIIYIDASGSTKKNERPLASMGSHGVMFVAGNWIIA